MVAKILFNIRWNSKTRIEELSNRIADEKVTAMASATMEFGKMNNSVHVKNRDVLIIFGLSAMDL